METCTGKLQATAHKKFDEGKWGREFFITLLRSEFGMIPGLSYSEMMIFGIIALLLFGSKLPEVARNLGKSMVEFKKGMRGLEEELRSVVRETNAPPQRTAAKPTTPASRPSPPEEQPKWSAPKFEPPSAEPQG